MTFYVKILMDLCEFKGLEEGSCRRWEDIRAEQYYVFPKHFEFDGIHSFRNNLIHQFKLN